MAALTPTVELFGHFTLVEGYAVPTSNGCHALVNLRDEPGTTVAMLTSQHRFQTLFETALATGNLIAFHGAKLTNPPTPLGGTWAQPDRLPRRQADQPANAAGRHVGGRYLLL